MHCLFACIVWLLESFAFFSLFALLISLHGLLVVRSFLGARWVDCSFDCLFVGLRCLVV